MATLNTGNLTLADLAKRSEDKKIATIVELLSETNGILEDMVWMEGNLVTGHKTTIRSAMPSVTWRKLNYGVVPSKSGTVQVIDSCGMLEGYSVIDKDLAMLNGNTAEFRLSEDRAFLEAMSQELSDTLFYGDSSLDPEQFMGLTPRYSELTSAANSDNVIAGSGASTDNNSIWLICWDDSVCHGIVPKGSKAGLQHTDLGEDTVSDGNSGEYQALRTHYQWKAGLTLRDWRYVVRIANIDTAGLLITAATGPNLVDLMIQAVERVPKLRGRPVFYCNQLIHSMLRRQIVSKANVNLSLDTVMGHKVMSMDGIPVKRCDSLTGAETLVS